MLKELLTNSWRESIFVPTSIHAKLVFLLFPSLASPHWKMIFLDAKYSDIKGPWQSQNCSLPYWKNRNNITTVRFWLYISIRQWQSSSSLIWMEPNDHTLFSWVIFWRETVFQNNNHLKIFVLLSYVDLFIQQTFIFKYFLSFRLCYTLRIKRWTEPTPWRFTV